MTGAEQVEDWVARASLRVAERLTAARVRGVWKDKATLDHPGRTPRVLRQNVLPTPDLTSYTGGMSRSLRPMGHQSLQAQPPGSWTGGGLRCWMGWTSWVFSASLAKLASYPGTGECYRSPG